MSSPTETVRRPRRTASSVLQTVLRAAARTLLVALTLVTCIDVVARYWFNAPLSGAYELTEIFLASVQISALFGKLGFRALGEAIGESARATAVIFALIICADIFTNFVNFAGLPDALSVFVNDLGLNPWLMIAAIIVVYLLLGCVLESLSMILLTVPVFYPLVMELDFGTGPLADPELVLIWFAIVVVVVTEISLITPPVGLNVFVLRSVLEDVSPATTFKGVTRFWMAIILRLALLIAFPPLSLWLVMAMS